MSAPGGHGQGPDGHHVRVNLLGPFSVTRGELSAGPWPRPERQLVLVSPGLRIGREAACEALFPALGAQSAANALSRALSMARAALSPLGDEAVGLLCADRGRIWAGNDLAVEVDQAAHEAVLHKGLAMAPGARRHELLASALGEDGALLEDEPYADWALCASERDTGPVPKPEQLQREPTRDEVWGANTRIRRAFAARRPGYRAIRSRARSIGRW